MSVFHSFFSNFGQYLNTNQFNQSRGRAATPELFSEFLFFFIGVIFFLNLKDPQVQAVFFLFFLFFIKDVAFPPCSIQLICSSFSVIPSLLIQVQLKVWMRNKLQTSNSLTTLPFLSLKDLLFFSLLVHSCEDIALVFERLVRIHFLTLTHNKKHFNQSGGRPTTELNVRHYCL